MNDDMSDLAPALLMTVIIAIGLVAFEFRSAYLAQPTHTTEARFEKAKAEKSKAGKAKPQLAMDNRLHETR